jgi:dTDP-4-amino-4,6-dideoxygalactose transaminase
MDGVGSFGGPGQSIHLARPEITEADIQSVERVLRSGWLTTGKECELFERELESYLHIDHVVACSSATTAEEIALAYLELPRDARVAVPTWTFASTALAVERAGARPVLIDVDADDLNMSAESLGRALEGQIDAVIGVHFGGLPFSNGIRALCADADVPLIEDAAHAFGAWDERGMIAGRGSAGACFSFYATKNLTTGEGGAIATDSESLAEFARMYRLHGMVPNDPTGIHRYDVIAPGIKANLSDMQAALGRSQLTRFEASQARRRELVQLYRDGLSKTSVRFVAGPTNHGSADHIMTIDLLDRDRCHRVFRHLSASGVGASVHFRPLHRLTWFGKNGYEKSPSGLRTANEMDGRVLSLPLHVGLTDRDVEQVVERVAEAL